MTALTAWGVLTTLRGNINSRSCSKTPQVFFHIFPYFFSLYKVMKYNRLFSPVVQTRQDTSLI